MRSFAPHALPSFLSAKGAMRVEPSLEAEFPGLRVVAPELHDVVVRPAHPGLEALKRRVAEKTRARRAVPEAVKDEPIFRAYLESFWKVGVDPTKTRPAGEALTRRVLAGKELPTINTLVDACNLAPLETSVAIAAFDTAQLHPGALVLRRARSGESFVGIGMAGPVDMAGSEVVIEDEGDRELVAMYPYLNAGRSKVTGATRSALLLICGAQTIEDGPLKSSLELCERWFADSCGGHATVVVVCQDMLPAKLSGDLAAHGHASIPIPSRSRQIPSTFGAGNLC